MKMARLHTFVDVNIGERQQLITRQQFYLSHCRTLIL